MQEGIAMPFISVWGVSSVAVRGRKGELALSGQQDPLISLQHSCFLVILLFYYLIQLFWCIYCV